MDCAHMNISETNWCSRTDHDVNRQSRLRFVWTGGGAKNKKRDFINLSHCKTSPNTMLRCRNILYDLLLCAVLLLCLSCQTALCQTTTTCPANAPCFADAVNLALAGAGRSCEVSTTCGTSGITYYTKDASLLETTQYACDATNDTIKHPKEYMTDTSTESVAFQGNAPETMAYPKSSTYWQSENSRTEVGGVPSSPKIEWITLNLTDPFLIRYIRIIYVSPHIDSATSKSDMRPNALCFERKRFQTDTEWMPMRYYAKNCTKSFPTVAYQANGQVFSSTTPVCIQSYYATDRNTDVGYGYGRQEVSKPQHLCFLKVILIH